MSIALNRHMSESTPEAILGANIARIRRACGLSQEALAERAELHRTYISDIERGNRNVSVRNIFQIARALGCAPSDLVEEE
jgi:transcriptional regulator with XRE-family HTH domain